MPEPQWWYNWFLLKDAKFPDQPHMLQMECFVNPINDNNRHYYVQPSFNINGPTDKYQVPGFAKKTVLINPPDPSDASFVGYAGKGFRPHVMYDRDGNAHTANTYKVHLQYKNMGYTHSENKKGGTISIERIKMMRKKIV